MSTRDRRLPTKPTPRGTVRGVFLVFFVYLCVRLWLFALWAMGRSALHVARPEAVAGIIPVGAYTSFFAWIKTGVFDSVVPAGVVIVIGALTLSVLLKRGFCGWICPVGTVFEATASVGRFVRRNVPGTPKWLGRNLPVPSGVDRALRGVRYAVTALILAFVALVPAEAALQFQTLPYYAAADVKILSYFVSPPLWYAGLGAVLLGGSFAFGNVWCRYLCPLGGLYGALGSASACTVVRDAESCIDCKACAKVCHAGVRVDVATSVRAPECDGCMDCVLACPKRGALTPRAFGLLRMPWWAWPAAVISVWLTAYAVAVLTGHWHSPLPESYFADAIRTLGL
ncbi:MAG TPA: 4Fe-4S binding protein [Coriobacteriia bacterium]|jgi:polyferredoxin